MKNIEFDNRLIELVAVYEQMTDVPYEEKVTDYFGDLALYHLVDNVDIDKARNICDKALEAIGMTKEEFLSSDDFVYTSAIRNRMAEKMQAENMQGKRFELATIFDKPVLFTCERLDRKNIPEGVFCYDIRHDDDGQGDMCELKDYVMVNHWGTVLCKEEFEPMEIDGIVYSTKQGIVMGEDDYNYTGEEYTLENYLENYESIKESMNDQNEDCGMNMNM